MVLEEFKFDFQSLTERKQKDLKERDIDYILLMVEHDGFKSKTPSHLMSLMGKPVASYVKKVCEKSPKTIEMENDGDVLETIHPILGDAEWTVVLFSDTPLLTYKTLFEAFNFAENSEMNVVKLKRGFIFKTEYIKRVDKIYTPNTLFADSEDFLVADNFSSLAKISEIMKKRILNNFMSSGVQIVDPASTYIESLVTIGEGTIIYPNTCIMGDSHIGENSTVGYGSTIKNSVVGDRCNIQNSLILSSVIMDSSLIEQSTIENNSLVEKNCVIKQYSIISSSKVGKNSFICWSKIKGVEINENTKIEN